MASWNGHTAACCVLLIRSTLLDTTGRPKSCCQARCLVCTGTQPSLVGCRCPRTLGQQGHWCAQQVRSACRRHGSWRWVQIHRPQPTCSQRMQLAAELGESRPAPAESLPQLHKGVVVHVCLLGFWPDLHAFRSLVSGNPSTLAACQDLLLVGCSRCINPFLWCFMASAKGALVAVTWPAQDLLHICLLQLVRRPRPLVCRRLAPRRPSVRWSVNGRRSA